MGWAPDYVSLEELAAHVRVGDSADDVELALAVAAASRAIDQACNRQFGKVDAPTARYYTARWDARLGQWAVDIDDLMTTTDLAVAFDSAGDQTYASSITAYALQPINAAADGRPWAHLYVRASSTVQPYTFLAGTGSAAGPVDSVKVTARWGWSGIPDAVRQACLIQAHRFLSRRDSPYGIAGSPETGSELRLLASLDPDVRTSLRPYRRVWGAV